jgi:hypothetical protein
LVGGLLTLFVFRRELAHVRWIVGYVLLLWVLLGVLAQGRSRLEARGRRGVLAAADYLVQTLYHGVLLFLLPVYYTSATLDSPNVWLVALMAGLAVLATFDPWYQAVVHPRPWLQYVFFVVASFGALNLALPLVGVPPHQALLAAAWLTPMGLVPAVCRARGWAWGRGLGAMAGVGVLAAAVAWAGRATIPPVPLFAARRAVAWSVEGLETLEPAPQPVLARELRSRGLVVFTAIYAPAGLRQPVRHVWRREGQVVDVVPLAPVHGGRREGFRTYSRKTAFPAIVAGRWTVDVVTDSGQLVGRVRFRVVD